MLSHKVVLIAAFAAFCSFSLAVKENFPFSNYPMYGDPDPVSEYYFLADGDGKALPIRSITGVTCPQLGKILRKRGEDRGKELGVKRRKLPIEERDKLARITLADLRAKAEKNTRGLPQKLRIMYVKIEFKDGRIVEIPEVYFAE